MKKVLRLKKGSVFQIQKEIDQKIIRYEVKIDHLDDQSISAKIQKEQSMLISDIIDNKGIIVAMPNKRSKAELIVQKLSEIGIQNIYLWPSERSIITKKNNNKRARLEKISHEATEQSRGWILPKITFVSDISKLISNKNIIVFDLNLSGNVDAKLENQGDTLAIIGPEGGLTDKDYAKFGDKMHILGLGSSVLRMETAAIVGSWLLKNQL